MNSKSPFFQPATKTVSKQPVSNSSANQKPSPLLKSSTTKSVTPPVPKRAISSSQISQVNHASSNNAEGTSQTQVIIPSNHQLPPTVEARLSGAEVVESEHPIREQSQNSNFQSTISSSEVLEETNLSPKDQSDDANINESLPPPQKAITETVKAMNSFQSYLSQKRTSTNAIHSTIKTEGQARGPLPIASEDNVTTMGAAPSDSPPADQGFPSSPSVPICAPPSSLPPLSTPPATHIPPPPPSPPHRVIDSHVHDSDPSGYEHPGHKSESSPAQSSPIIKEPIVASVSSHARNIGQKQVSTKNPIHKESAAGPIPRFSLAVSIYYLSPPTHFAVLYLSN
jgi:hypothetical protein